MTPWAPFPHYGLSGVRVWQRATPFGMFQRHEWRKPDGSTAFDDWIPTPVRRFDPRSTPATDPRDPGSVALDALRQIAAGHNDARTLAAETLATLTRLA